MQVSPVYSWNVERTLIFHDAIQADVPPPKWEEVFGNSSLLLSVDIGSGAELDGLVSRLSEICLLDCGEVECMNSFFQLRRIVYSRQRAVFITLRISKF